MHIKTLKFEPQLINGIVNREITCTWRVFDDKNLQVGDVLGIVDKTDTKIVAYAKINKITEKYLQDIDETDQTGHMKFNNLDEIISLFRKYYGNGVNKQTPIKIIHFILLDQKPTKMVAKKSTLFTELKLYTDGGSRGNPGPSACAFIIFDTEDRIIEQGGSYLGITTNNQAEYQAVKAGLKRVKNYGAKTVHVYLDSLLVVNQMIGVYKIRNRELWPIHQDIVELIKQFKKVSFSHIPREMNKIADKQVNEIIDRQDISGQASDLI